MGDNSDLKRTKKKQDVLVIVAFIVAAGIVAAFLS